MTSNSEHWCTPKNVLDAVSEFNGGEPIGLDPCSNERSIVDARTTWNFDGEVGIDGLAQEWCGHGLVFVNPPYGDELSLWMRKIRLEAANGVEIIALVPSRTDCGWFQLAWRAPAICFWKGRLRFLGAPSSAPFPSALLYFGERVYRFADVFSSNGHVVLGVGR